MTTGPPVLMIEHVTKDYRKGVRANDDVSLQVAAGEVFGLLGHNGAGKTTLLNQIIGIAQPTRGAIRIDGQDAVADPHGGVNRAVHRDDLPYRFGPGEAWVLPLYVSYDLAGQSIVFGGEDSGVSNDEGRDGLRLLNLVAAQQPFPSRGAFVRTVTELSLQWYRGGLFTRRGKPCSLQPPDPEWGSRLRQRLPTPNCRRK